ncbi:MAG: Rieske (2Fe-2S) domain protein [Verrucomicrobiales bacterium]|nr:Rieske (2Fe-2S) domain protein [Verrucomicrobiales bacterium]
MKELLEGKPFKHPLHTALVHFPIALFSLSFLLDLASLLWPDAARFVPAAFYSLVFGIVTALITAIPGFVDYNDIRTDHPAKRTATLHMILNLVAVGLYCISIGMRYGNLDALKTPLGPFLLSLAGIVSISISGYLGGVLIYDDGIAVGRHRRRTTTPETTLRFSRSDAADGFVEVARADALRNGETLRLEVNGTAMALARYEGQFFAVQEFCTHRFGPLSEGCVKDGNVECPWHCSCFDLRTGKVTKGPAKVDLKTFTVQVRDGKVFVAVPEAPQPAGFVPSPQRPRRRFFLPKRFREA